MSIDGFSIEGDIRTADAVVSFSPELLGLVQTEPPTAASLEAIREVGKEIGGAVCRSIGNATLREKEADTTEPRTVTEIVLDMASAQKLPFATLSILGEGVQVGANIEREALQQRVGSANLLSDVARALRVIRKHRETIAAEAGRQQSETVRILTDELHKLNRTA